MTVLNFPATPAFNDTYTENGVTYTWNGTYWDANSGSPLDDKYVEVAGDVMTGNLLLPGGGGNTAALQKQEIEAFPVSTFDNDSGYITSADIPPGTVSYWNKVGDTLEPVTATDNVEIGDGKITLDGTSGNVNISSSSTGDVLTVKTGTTLSGTVANFGRSDLAVNLGIGYNDQGSMSIGTSTNHDLDFQTGAVTQAVLENGTGNLLIGGDIAGGNPAITLNADGSSVFNGSSAIVGRGANANSQREIRFLTSNGTNNTGAAIGHDPTTNALILSGTTSIAGAQHMAIDPIGNVLIGGPLPSDPAISLNADGSGLFMGDIKSQSSTPDKYSSLSQGGIDAQWLADGNDPTSLNRLYIGRSSLNIWSAYEAGTPTAALRANGDLFLGGSNVNSEPPALNPNIALNGSDGTASFAGGIGVQYLVAGNVAGAGSVMLSLKAGGAEWLRARGDKHLLIGGDPSGPTTTNIYFNGNTGSAVFKGTVQTAGGVVTPSMVLQLEADDETKYTTDVDEEGNETQTYNGATLDVKESIETATTARLAMRETFQELLVAVQSATDFGQLKAAMLVALEDYA